MDSNGSNIRQTRAISARSRLDRRARLRGVPSNWIRYRLLTAHFRRLVTAVLAVGLTVALPRVQYAPAVGHALELDVRTW